MLSLLSLGYKRWLYFKYHVILLIKHGVVVSIWYFQDIYLIFFGVVEHLQFVSQHVSMVIFGYTATWQNAVVFELIYSPTFDKGLILFIIVIDGQIILEIELNMVSLQMMTRADIHAIQSYLNLRREFLFLDFLGWVLSINPLTVKVGYLACVVDTLYNLRLNLMLEYIDFDLNLLLCFYNNSGTLLFINLT